MDTSFLRTKDKAAEHFAQASDVSALTISAPGSVRKYHRRSRASRIGRFELMILHKELN
jgi:hypothetical protein